LVNSTGFNRKESMTPTHHAKMEWSRMAQDCYGRDRNDLGHKYSAAASIEVGPERQGVFAKRTGMFSARLGDASVLGQDKNAAVDNLFAKLTAFLASSGHREYYFSPSGKTCFILYPGFDGWCYDITSPEHKHASTCMFNSSMTLEKASEDVRAHALSYED
jgi:hypothetical protein